VNRLIELLPPSDQEKVHREGVVTSLRLRKELYATGDVVEAVYFPVDCVISIVVGTGENARVEMATVGVEGAVGAFSLLGPGRALGNAVVQVGGDALRLHVDKYRKLVEESGPFARVMERYLFALIRQVFQAGACNRIHTMEERCARWLLMMHDRMNTDTFPLTQEFLAEMLGVRRATVNIALGILKSAGFVRYVRGQITIADRAGLESAACPCYEIIRDEFKNVTAD
jgi:CRP-like cAMP-binding protein